MTDRETFLRAIRETPADDTPRLVFADWLDEHGEGEYAEFIRVQIRLAGIVSVPDADRCVIDPTALKPHRCKWCRWVGKVDKVRKPLESRERELWHRIPTALTFAPWSSGISTDPDSPRFWLGDQSGPLLTVSRGFAGRLECTIAAFLGGPCGRCDGDGRAHGSDRPFEWSPDPDYMKCPDCGGSGTLPGVAAAVFAAHPVTAVTVSDKRPWAGNWFAADRRGAPDVFGWWCSEHLGDEASNLPAAVLDHMAADPRRLPTPQDYRPGNGGHGCVMFAHHATAVDAAAFAFAALGRDLAGLPPLTPHAGPART